MASITQRTSPFPIVVPTSTNIGLSELVSIKVPIIGDFIVMYFFSTTGATTAATGAAFEQALLVDYEQAFVAHK
jgi:hypothetical protein